jgi:hypothetical protein
MPGKSIWKIRAIALDCARRRNVSFDFAIAPPWRGTGRTGNANPVAVNRNLMKTAVIEGTAPSGCDPRLLSSMPLSQSAPHAVWRETILLGIRNEYGEVYRAIGISGRAAFLEAMSQLRALGFTYEVTNPKEAQQRFDAIVSAPVV